MIKSFIDLLLVPIDFTPIARYLFNIITLGGRILPYTDALWKILSIEVGPGDILWLIDFTGPRRPQSDDYSYTCRHNYSYATDDTCAGATKMPHLAVGSTVCEPAPGFFDGNIWFGDTGHTAFSDSCNFSDINPATGLMMVGCCDTEGNMWGTGSFND